MGAAIAYFTLLEGLFGETVGKAVVGLRVTDQEGRRAGWRAVLVRNVLRVVDSFPGVYLVGALVARFSPLHQRIGDRVAGTLVVRARAAVGPTLTDEQRRRRLGVVLGVVGLFIASCAAFFYLGRPPIVLDNTARLGQFPGGRVVTYRHGTAQLHGGSVTYPVTYTLAGSGKACSATITLYWRGFPQGWTMGSGESRC